MKFGLSKETTQKINAIFEKYSEIEKVVVYGSRAKGNYREGSDIDITLMGNKLTHSLLLKIIGELEELKTPYLYDVSLFTELHSPDLESHIQRVGQIFYQKVGAK